MSDAIKKHLTDLGSWTFKGLLSIAAGMAIFIFNEMRDSIHDIQTITQDISKIAIRLEAKVERNEQDIRHLEDTKADK